MASSQPSRQRVAVESSLLEFVAVVPPFLKRASADFLAPHRPVVPFSPPYPHTPRFFNGVYGDIPQVGPPFRFAWLPKSNDANSYWNAWRKVTISFPKRDLHRVAEHWRTFGARVSPLTGSLRLDANPVNAILNYLIGSQVGVKKLRRRYCEILLR